MVSERKSEDSSLRPWLPKQLFFFYFGGGGGGGVSPVGTDPCTALDGFPEPQVWTSQGHSETLEDPRDPEHVLPPRPSSGLSNPKPPTPSLVTVKLG